MAQSQGKMPTEKQISAGGVAYRREKSGIQVALICVGEKARWQLPKGLVEPGEEPAETALREVREEAGIETDLLAPIDVIEYWYVGYKNGQRVRYHKFVHFFLLRYLRGDVTDHDHEVDEARWVDLAHALEMVAFPNERQLIARARELIAALDPPAA